MPRTEPNSEAWRKMVLRSMPPPAWLGADAPDGDVVISSRCRHARNVAGYRFPHHASAEELMAIQRAVLESVQSYPAKLDAYKRLSEAERDFLLGSRLVSPEFAHRKPGRLLLLSEDRVLSLMVNEEDHLRLQALTAGWSLGAAEVASDRLLSSLSKHLKFMRSEPWGYLTASPANVGEARRRSALFHLIGLAHGKRLNQVLKALAEWGLTARGLFGESSRAVGAFFQVSSTHGSAAEFVGAVEYLIREERESRKDMSNAELEERTRQAVEFAVASREVSLADALRVLAWVRWAAAAHVLGLKFTYRDVDSWTSTMEVHGTQDEHTAARHRAEFLRERIEIL